MKTLSLVLAVLTCSAFAAAGGVSDVPSLIPDPRGEPPAWVAADVALEDGQWKAELLGWHLEGLRAIAKRNREALGETLTGTRRAEPRPCTSFEVQPVSENFDPADTLADLTHHGKSIVTGRVVAIRQGFWYGLPASLLKIDGAWLKGRPSTTTYLVYPFAHIDTGDGPICSKVIGDSIPPQIGDRVIAFSYAEPFGFDGGSVVVADIRNRVAYEHLDGPARVPAALQKLVANGTSAVDEIRKATQAFIAQSSER